MDKNSFVRLFNLIINFKMSPDQKYKLICELSTEFPADPDLDLENIEVYKNATNWDKAFDAYLAWESAMNFTKHLFDYLEKRGLNMINNISSDKYNPLKDENTFNHICETIALLLEDEMIMTKDVKKAVNSVNNAILRELMELRNEPTVTQEEFEKSIGLKK